ncbi:cytochrome P450 [Pseudonocardia halophobica]|uniref:Cytochrome P450 n=1 Tax=Pseudonocardia halophobica TaxID=29401 RepID=A0A9W6P017_9PSEU|nr:cytochrome P450 [Pseudonocardia halophobica]GLL15347.1 cytochrome P450 [Pseudonocardia halophobica]
MTAPDTRGCPVRADVDPFDPAYLADPYPLLAELREHEPVAYLPVLDMWAVTRHADIDAVFRDPATFSASIAQDPIFPPAREAREVLAGFRAAPTMSNCDPPKHTRIRRHTARAFSARRIAVVEPAIRAKAGELIAAMLREPEADVVESLTFPLPASMIFTLIGFPPGDTEMLRGWCGNRTAFSWGRPTVEEQTGIARNMVRYWRYCEDFVHARLADPADDYTSDLLRAHLADPEDLTVDEIVNVVYGLSFAGHETTTNLTTNGLRRLLEDRSRWEALCADPALIPAAVEEVLRYDTSVIAWRRRTTRPVSVGGVDLPEGARLLLLLGAAGRDPRAHPEPDTFDLRREPRPHLAFGKGVHFCLGAPLARSEFRILLELLLAAAPDLELVPDQELRFSPNVSFRGPRRLLVRRGGG